MGRIRSSKPEWWKSAKWCRLSRDLRATYKGIWEVMCDDEGRFLADPRQIKADVWPLDDDITPKKLAAWLPKLAQVSVTVEGGVRAPSIQLYAMDGVTYGYLAAFNKHQKISHPTPSKLPKPPSLDKNNSGIAPESSGTSPEPLRPDVDVDSDLDLEVDLEKEGTPPAADAIQAMAACFPNRVGATEMLIGMTKGLGARGMKPVPVEILTEAMGELRTSGGDVTPHRFKAFVGKILDRQSREAEPSRNGSSKPKGSTTRAMQLIGIVRGKRNPMYPNNVLPEWQQGLSDGEATVIKTVGITRILNDQNEGTIVAQLARALEETRA